MSGPTSAAEERSAAKRAAALTSLVAASAITLLKLITGILTGSLGMLSEAAHSSIDLIAAAITLFTVRVSDRPADKDHNYGHGKLESLSASFEILLMLGSCVWIAQEAVRRVLYHSQKLDLRFSVWPFIVLLLSMTVDYGRSRTLRRVAEEQRSDALKADALHFGTDLWSAGAVFVGLLASFAGARLHLPLLQYADPVAALVVSVIILRVTWMLARQTLDSLLDATPPEIRDEIHRDLMNELNAIPDVLSVDRVRVRKSGSDYFVDLALGMPRNLTFQRTEQITSAATEAVKRRLPGADVVVRNVPMAPDRESVFDSIRAVAAQFNVSIHDVSVQQFEGSLHVEQHLEVPADMPLRQAHELVTHVEADIRRQVPGVTSVLTHIESQPVTIEFGAQLEGDRKLTEELRELVSRFPEVHDVHDIVVAHAHGASEGIQINCHCTLPDELTMERVHAIITDFERAFRRDHPNVARVLIHPEPITDNRR
ncbi:MAG TPA: cation-efflux pump [Acidobacteriaceae bacterium]|jgi:cation diffusion facilitator family transporter